MNGTSHHRAGTPQSCWYQQIGGTRHTVSLRTRDKHMWAQLQDGFDTRPEVRWLNKTFRVVVRKELAFRSVVLANRLDWLACLAVEARLEECRLHHQKRL